MTITEFLLARIAEEEEVVTRIGFAVLASEGSFASIVLDHPELAAGDCPGYLADYDVARVAAGCLARRTVVEMLDQPQVPSPEGSTRTQAMAMHGFNEGVQFAAEAAVLALACAYADHPDFQKDWLA